jgi:hypothetical protein
MKAFASWTFAASRIHADRASELVSKSTGLAQGHPRAAAGRRGSRLLPRPGSSGRGCGC